MYDMMTSDDLQPCSMQCQCVIWCGGACRTALCCVFARSCVHDSAHLGRPWGKATAEQAAVAEAWGPLPSSTTDTMAYCMMLYVLVVVYLRYCV